MHAQRERERERKKEGNKKKKRIIFDLRELQTSSVYFRVGSSEDFHFSIDLSQILTHHAVGEKAKKKQDENKKN